MTLPPRARRTVFWRSLVLLPYVLAAVAAPSSAQAPGDPSRYYAILFGAGVSPIRPGKTHTWATYVRATPTPAGTVVDPVTISWLPVSGGPNVLRPFRPEPGRNLTLDGSLRYAAGNRARVVAYGPFEIDAGRYHAAVAQAARLESGAVQYRAVDSVRRRPGVAHCVHAITDADPVLGGTRQPWYWIGVRGTGVLAGQYAAAGAVPAPQAAGWLYPALGLAR